MDDARTAQTQEPPEVVVKSDEQYAYGFIMEVLTRGLYPDKLHVVREYVQNGFDAILELRKKGFGGDDTRIELKVSPPSLFIYDNGVGMDAQRMAEYRYVGYSRKLTAESVWIQRNWKTFRNFSC
jgi:molecular chaperone HtpG